MLKTDPYTGVQIQIRPSTGRSEAHYVRVSVAIGVDIVDVDCPWFYADLHMALRGLLSAGPVERAIRASGIEKVRAAVTEAIAPYRTADGAYELRNIFRVLIARA